MDRIIGRRCAWYRVVTTDYYVKILRFVIAGILCVNDGAMVTPATIGTIGCKGAQIRKSLGGGVVPEKVVGV